MSLRTNEDMHLDHGSWIGWTEDLRAIYVLPLIGLSGQQNVLTSKE